MKHRVVILFIIIALLAAGYALFGEPYEKETSSIIPVTVTKIIDGDTIVVEGGQRVRLLNIDTRERGEQCYSEAKERLEELILLREVTLERDAENKDRYDRLLRHILINGTNINLLMVEEGLAVAYIYEPNVKYADLFAEAEQVGKEREGCVWTKSP